MCGRYTLNKSADDVAKRFNLSSRPSQDIRPNYNVAPSQTMPVVIKEADGDRVMEMMKWGIPRILGKDLVKELFNTRSDKAFGGFWKKTVLNRRCLVPATGFYEWKAGLSGKVPYFIHPKDEDLYAFAGIWDTWKSDEGQEVKTYSIMTSEPNREMRAIHNRMPVILHQADEATWLDLSNDTPIALDRLLSPSEDGRLDIYEVSRGVNNSRNNSEGLLLPVV